MDSLCQTGSPFKKTERVIDYNAPVEAEEGFGLLPTSNVLKYILEDGSWLAICPSGAELKIKNYFSIKGTGENDADQKLTVIRNTITRTLGL